MRRQTLSSLLLALACGQASWALGGEMVVIVSTRNATEALRADQVADIFLGQSRRFPDGALAGAVDQPIGAAQRDVFYLKVAAKSPALLRSYWTKIIFTGRGQPPREVPDSASVRKLVADNPGLIGYIDRNALNASVKPVLVVR